MSLKQRTLGVSAHIQKGVRVRTNVVKFIAQFWVQQFLESNSFKRIEKIASHPLLSKLVKPWPKFGQLTTSIYTESELEELLSLKLDPVTQKAVSEALVAAYTKRFLKLVKGA